MVSFIGDEINLLDGTLRVVAELVIQVCQRQVGEDTCMEGRGHLAIIHVRFNG